MAALGTRLNTISGLRGFPIAPDDPPVPCAFPLVPDVPSYREAMRRGTYVVTYQVALLTGAQADTGQAKLARYASPTGPTSIRAVLEDGDKTLDGLIDDLVVDSFASRGLEEVGLIGYYGGLFQVRVIASGV
ncbi:hypothetical protein ABZU92_18335 [Micromonospora arida]|uniref:hypothetical protein n=1 Tax=Micromonospora arida TaxID=2203715 RepID=UPI0033B41E4E